MNERIKQLAEQARIKDHWSIDEGRYLTNYLNEQKFAELIVRECSVYCQGHILPKGIAEENDLNYNDGVMDCAIGLKQHFGVE
jgi:hypothetical protein